MGVSAPSPPALPRLYRLVALDSADNALAEACRRAEAGAEEGTLIWVRRPQEGAARPGRVWQPAEQGLHGALVLRPDMPLEQAAELVFVGALALGEALAERVEALVELHYRWPNDVLLRHGKVAGLQLRVPPRGGAVPPWVALGLAVNIAGTPADLGLRAASVREEGESDADAEALLEGFARHFLPWVDRWAEEGFAPVRRAWLRRVSVLEQDLEFQVGDRHHRGRQEDLGPGGALVLAAEDGSTATVKVSEFFGLPQA